MSVAHECYADSLHIRMGMPSNSHRPRRTPSRRKRSDVFFRIQNERTGDIFGLEGLKDWPELQEGIDAFWGQR